MPASSTELNLAFAALADPTRRAILQRLAGGEATVNELAAPFAISAPAISRHLRVLEAAGLMVRSRDGQRHRCRLQADTLRQAAAWLDFHRRFWSGSFERLGAHLKTRRKTHGSKNPQRR